MLIDVQHRILPRWLWIGRLHWSCTIDIGISVTIFILMTTKKNRMNRTQALYAQTPRISNKYTFFVVLCCSIYRIGSAIVWWEEIFKTFQSNWFVGSRRSWIIFVSFRTFSAIVFKTVITVVVVFIAIRTEESILIVSFQFRICVLRLRTLNKGYDGVCNWNCISLTWGAKLSTNVRHSHMVVLRCVCQKQMYRKISFSSIESWIK